MYRCGACNSLAKPNEPLKKHVTYREVEYSRRGENGALETATRKEIVKEIPVCAECSRLLNLGTPFASLKKETQKPKQYAVEERPLTREEFIALATPLSKLKGK